MTILLRWQLDYTDRQSARDWVEHTDTTIVELERVSRQRPNFS